MKHLGDITKIDGSAIEPVDCITFGAPCQDLSVAGQRKGMLHADLGDEETSRSGLFMEAVRIIKEMRNRDIHNGRSGVDVRPRYAVYENVPGAFSSNGGKDWQTVLTELIRIVEPDAPDVPMPNKGSWPHAGCFYGELGGWSIAYRLHDAQHWGVPQRRKRLAICCDFNGLTAAEILFDPQLRGETESTQPDQTVRDSSTRRRPEVPPVTSGLPWDSEPSGTEREGTAEGAAGCADGASADGNGLSFQERAGKPGGAKDCSCNMNTSEPCQRSKTSQSSQNHWEDGDDDDHGPYDVEDEPTAYGISPFDSEGMKSSNPKVGFYKADTSRTLDPNGGNPSCQQGGACGSRLRS